MLYNITGIKYSACDFEQHKIRMNRPIYFRGGNSFLSNFYACRIDAWGHIFNTVEAAYQYRKCIFYDDVETAEKMLATRTGLQAKYLSKTIREKEHIRAQWNKQRRSVMTALVAIKFRDTTLRKRLLDTYPSPLMECVRSREGFWSMLTYTGQSGQNELGQILVNCREFVRKNQATGTHARQQRPDDRNAQR